MQQWEIAFDDMQQWKIAFDDMQQWEIASIMIIVDFSLKIFNAISPFLIVQSLLTYTAISQGGYRNLLVVVPAISSLLHFLKREIFREIAAVFCNLGVVLRLQN